jgi:hypothetical protein
MSWVLDLTDAIRESIPAGDALALGALLVIAVTALVLPFVGMRRRRRIDNRDEEYQRLQNM